MRIILLFINKTGRTTKRILVSVATRLQFEITSAQNQNKMAKNLFGIFIWINDDPVTGNVLNLTNIVEPRKGLDDYKEGETVKAKCPSYGHQIAVIGKIAGKIIIFIINVIYIFCFNNFKYF